MLRCGVLSWIEVNRDVFSCVVLLVCAILYCTVLVYVVQWCAVLSYGVMWYDV